MFVNKTEFGILELLRSDQTKKRTVADIARSLDHKHQTVATYISKLKNDKLVRTERIETDDRPLNVVMLISTDYKLRDVKNRKQPTLKLSQKQAEIYEHLKDGPLSIDELERHFTDYKNGAVKHTVRRLQKRGLIKTENRVIKDEDTKKYRDVPFAVRVLDVEYNVYEQTSENPAQNSMSYIYEGFCPRIQKLVLSKRFCL